MVRSILLFASAALGIAALVVAGCDSAPEQQAQAPETKGARSGTIDREFAGEPLASLTFTDSGGRQLDLGALERPVLINLWATWCAPCLKEMPALDQLASEFAGRLEVRTISQDLRGGEVVDRYFADHSFTHLEPWLDPQNTLSAALAGETLLPITVLYDAEGREIFRVSGGYEWDSETAIALVEEELAAREQ